MAKQSTARLLGIAAGWLVGVALLLLGAPSANAASCERADQIAATTGRGDRDFDGISNCTERNVLGTSQRDPDTDDDDVDDGDEVVDGTDPLDADTDDDGVNDGGEEELGTDPQDADSDDDGEIDGDDPDPTQELEDQIESDVEALVCPADGGNGSIVLLGIDIVLTPATEYDSVESCQALAERITAHGGAHVEVEVVQTETGLVAEEVELQDGDHDGSPDDVDQDDDGDGVDDDLDDDAAGGLEG